MVDYPTDRYVHALLDSTFGVLEIYFYGIDITAEIDSCLSENYSDKEGCFLWEN